MYDIHSQESTAVNIKTRKKKRTQQYEKRKKKAYVRVVLIAHLEKGRVREVPIFVSYVQISGDYQRAVITVHKVSNVGIPLLPGVAIV